MAAAALRSAAVREVRRDDHAAVLKVWSKRHQDLGRARTRVACRLHQVLCELIPGGVAKEITAGQAGQILASITPMGAVAAARWELAAECLLASALATKVSWEVPFDVVDAAALGPSRWSDRLRRVLRPPRGDPRHRQYLWLGRHHRLASYAASDLAPRVTSTSSAGISAKRSRASAAAVADTSLRDRRAELGGQVQVLAYIARMSRELLHCDHPPGTRQVGRSFTHGRPALTSAPSTAASLSAEEPITSPPRLSRGLLDFRCARTLSFLGSARSAIREEPS